MIERRAGGAICLSEALTLVDGAMLRSALDEGELRAVKNVGGRRVVGLWFVRGRVIELANTGIVLGSQERRAEIWRLWKDGATLGALGTAFGISRSRVTQVIARHQRHLDWIERQRQRGLASFTMPAIPPKH